MKPSPLLDRQHGALLLVDYQARLMPAIDAHERVLREALLLARAARTLDVPVLGTEQNPAGLGPNVAELRTLCHRTLGKTCFDAAADDADGGLVAALHAARPRLQQVVVAGCEAHVCLLQTALGLVAAGLRVFVVPAACGSRRPEDKALALARLQQAGATLVASEMVIFEWLRACTDPQFKDALALVKAHPLD